MRDRRHQDIDPDRRHSYFWFGWHPGMFINVLPAGFISIYVGGTPPLGVTMTELPPGATPVIINGVQYYQALGAYFLPVMQGSVTVFTTVQP